MFLEYFRLIVSDLKNRKFASFLTLLSISLGILSIFAIVLVGQGFENSVKVFFEDFGANKLMIEKENDGYFDKNDHNLILRQSYIKRAHPFFVEDSQVKFGNEYIHTEVVGSYLSDEFFEDFNKKVEVGRSAKENEKYSVVIGPRVANELFDKKVEVGNNIYIRDVKFKVVGIIESFGNAMDDSMILCNIETLQEIYGKNGKMHAIYAVAYPETDLEFAKINLDRTLERKYGEKSIETVTVVDILDEVNEILKILKGVLGGIAVISLIVGSLGIINTMYVVIGEKTKDIGVMKSIGATNFNVLSLYIIQSGIYGFLGAVLGIFFGTGLVLVLEKIVQANGFGFVTFTIDIPVIFSLLIFGFLIGLIAGYIPAREASKVKIVEAFKQ